jgi:Domain of unknown function (DUF397)
MNASWRKSSVSGKQGNCVLWAPVEDGVLIGDSKRPGEILGKFTIPEWEAFIAGVKIGEADL